MFSHWASAACIPIWGKKKTVKKKKSSQGLTQQEGEMFMFSSTAGPCLSTEFPSNAINLWWQNLHLTRGSGGRKYENSFFCMKRICRKYRLFTFSGFLQGILSSRYRQRRWDKAEVVKLQFLRHRGALVRGKCSFYAQLRDTLGLHWHRAPGQSQVVEEANWQSILGLTWLNDLVILQSTSRSSPPHRKEVGNHCYPQIMDFCQISSLSFLMLVVVCCPTALTWKRFWHIAMKICLGKSWPSCFVGQEFSETHDNTEAQDYYRNRSAGGNKKFVGGGHLVVCGLFRSTNYHSLGQVQRSLYKKLQ